MSVSIPIPSAAATTCGPPLAMDDENLSGLAQEVPPSSEAGVFGRVSFFRVYYARQFVRHVYLIAACGFQNMMLAREFEISGSLFSTFCRPLHLNQGVLARPIMFLVSLPPFVLAWRCILHPQQLSSRFTSARNRSSEACSATSSGTVNTEQLSRDSSGGCGGPNSAAKVGSSWKRC